MASPKIFAFNVFDVTTGAPLTGQAGSMSFDSYRDDTGTNLSQPTITEIGGGAYKFTPVFPSNRGISFVIDTGAGAAPAAISGYLRPEDFNVDNVDVASSVLQTAIAAAQVDITLIRKIQVGKWQIFDSGADANRMVFYDTDGTTVLFKVDLKDVFGAPTVANPFARIPV